MVAAVGQGSRLAAAAREVVRRREDQRDRQLHRSSRPRRPPQQGRHRLGRRARRHAHADVFRSPARSLGLRRCVEVTRRGERRSRRDLSADDPRARRRDAGVRTHRRDPQHRLRRLQRRVAARSHQRCEMPAAHHCRRRLPPRTGRPVEANRRRSARGHTVHRARRGGAARREPVSRHRTHHRRTRPLVPPLDAGREAQMRSRADGSEDMLYILYTSGTTGKPKGIVHTTGGYLVGTYATTKLVFDLKDDDVYWCSADIGWVTGHSYVVYGPLANGATVLMYEGAPDWPQKDRFWSLIEKYGVTIFYTAPTAIRAFMRWGTDWPAKHDLTSLRLLGSVGEPINPEAWVWYYRTIGGERCPVVDTWWQTETGAIMITPLPGVTTLKPGSATKPFPGISAEIRNERGQRVEVGGGLLALTRPWPTMLRGIYGDPERYVRQYWNKWGPAVYVTGDGAKRDADGYFWLLGRVDDVINVAGHRIGTMEVESALVDHPSVAEAAVVGRAHEIKGQAIAAFVTLKEGTAQHIGAKELIDHLKEHVVKKIGAIA